MINKVPEKLKTQHAEAIRPFVPKELQITDSRENARRITQVYVQLLVWYLPASFGLLFVENVKPPEVPGFDDHTIGHKTQFTHHYCCMSCMRNRPSVVNLLAPSGLGRQPRRPVPCRTLGALEVLT